ncbi:MAG TPA: hypothetical protein VK938_05335 [Methylophilaceae bacterium]|nr:hypothetical protein [Methylophilaceae bacterium]
MIFRYFLLHRRMRCAIQLFALTSLAMLAGCKPTEAAAGAYCQDRFTVSLADRNVLSVPEGHPVARPLSPVFFGFNMEWVDFQQDLWDASKQSVKPEVIAWLKPFSGTPYRYPGGTGSNYLDWKETVGPLDERPMRTHADWLPPFSPQFGFDEYLNFVKTVDGKAWIVLNLYGDYSGEGDKALLVERAAEWAAYADKAREAGALPILRWELGNELDRGRIKWPPEKYADIARSVARAVKQATPDAELVGMLQDWPAQSSYSMDKYNQIVMSGLKTVAQDFAHHFYYEGLTWETVGQRMEQACSTVESARLSNNKFQKLWITEHGRNLPESETIEERNRNWRKTVNLEAALIIAEAYIAATKLPEIESLFLHSLGTAHGPWPLFHGENDGGLHPSAVYWALRILRDSMLPEVLVSNMQSRDDEKSLGGHDIRATVMTNESRDSYAVWAINRFGETSSLKLSLPGLKGAKVMSRQVFIGDANKEANNYASADRIQPQQMEKTMEFDAEGTAVIDLPAYSVSAITFHVE